MDDFTFHALSLLTQSGMLAAMFGGLWKMGGIVQEFRETRLRLEEHIEDDKEQLHIVTTSLSGVRESVSRIEGRLNGGLRL